MSIVNVCVVELCIFIGISVTIRNILHECNVFVCVCLRVCLFVCVCVLP